MSGNSSSFISFCNNELSSLFTLKIFGISFSFQKFSRITLINNNLCLNIFWISFASLFNIVPKYMLFLSLKENKFSYRVSKIIWVSLK